MGGKRGKATDPEVLAKAMAMVLDQELDVGDVSRQLKVGRRILEDAVLSKLRADHRALTRELAKLTEEVEIERKYQVWMERERLLHGDG